MKIFSIKKVTMSILIGIVLISVYCGTSGVENKDTNESFVKFRAKFYSDTLFQRSRILFPLPGIDTDAMEYDDTIYYFQKDEWLFLVDMSIGEEMKVDIIKTDSTVHENMHWEDSNFDVNVFYKLIDSKWYLVRLEIYNM